MSRRALRWWGPAPSLLLQLRCHHLTIDIRDTAVQLSALVNPIDVFTPIFEAALENAQAVGEAIAANPAPILEQVIANQLGSIGNIGAGIEAQIGVIPRLPELLGDTIESQLGNLGDLAGLGQTFLANALGAITVTARCRSRSRGRSIS